MGREFRSRMRGARSYQILGGYTLALALLVLAVYFSLTRDELAATPNQYAATIGRGIWTWGCFGQAMLVPLIVPAFTCGAITLERERELLEMLLLTRQSTFQICLGKLGSGVGLGLMLVLSSVPVLALSVMLGGISPGEIVRCLLVLTTLVFVVGALGLLISTVSPRTVVSTVITYLFVGFPLLGLPLLVTLLQEAVGLHARDPQWGILAMLLATVALTFVPALGLASIFHAIRRFRGRPPAERIWWLVVGALCWWGLLAFLYLPGVDELLNHSDALLSFHPVVAIRSVMAPDLSRTGQNGALLLPGALSNDSLAPVCSVFYFGMGAWFFLVASLRVRKMRM